MIKNIKVKGVHGVEQELTFNKASKIVGQSLLGKTTILNCIMACYSGYFPGYQKTLPDGTVELSTDSGDIVMSNNRIIGSDLRSNDLIRNIVPGNFFKLNNSTVKQREVITKILDIDTDKIFNITSRLKDAQAEMKMFNIKKDQITDDIIRLEEQHSALDGILEKPEVVNQSKDNSTEIQVAYDRYIAKLESENKQIESENFKTDKEYNTEINKVEDTYKDEVTQLERDNNNITNKMYDIKTKATEAKKSSGDYTCESCGTVIKGENKEELINNYRIEYVKLQKKQKIIEARMTDIEGLIEAAKGLIRKPEMKSLHEIKTVQPLAYKSKVTGIKYIESDNTEYNKYLKELSDYNEVETKKSVITDEIKTKTAQLKDLNSVILDKEIKTLIKDREGFNKMLDEKVKETGLDIRLFKTLKNGNTKETFEIYDDEGNKYGETSHGNELYIELLLAKLFVKYLKLDFILIDKLESIGPNLRNKVMKECKGLQIIATEVSKETKMTIKDI